MSEDLEEPVAAVVAGEVQVRGLRVRGHHGVLAHERRDGQEFVVDVDLEVPGALEQAAGSDALADAVDYATLVDRLAADVAGEPVDLLETLAHRLALLCLEDRRVLSARVRVAKPSAPLDAEVDEVAVVVRLRRALDEDPERTAHEHPVVPVPPSRSAVLLSDDRRQAFVHGPVAEPVVVALGSSSGDRLENLRAGVRALVVGHGRVVAASSVWESPLLVPPGDALVGPADDVLNAVVLLTGEGPRGALIQGLTAEAVLGRPPVGQDGREPGRTASRVLDVDVVAHGRREETRPLAPALVLPHPRAHERAFVLLPWLEVDADAVLPGHGRVADLAARVEREGLRRREDLDGWADDLLDGQPDGAPS